MRGRLFVAVGLASVLGACSEAMAGGPPAMSRNYQNSVATGYRTPPRMHAPTKPTPKRGVSFYRGPRGDIQTMETLPFGSQSMSKGYEYIGGMDPYSPTPRKDPRDQWEYNFRTGYTRKKIR